MSKNNIFRLAVLLILLFFPVSVSAHSIDIISRGTVLTSDNALFRLRPSNTIWQKGTVSEALHLGKTANFRDRLFVITEQSGSYGLSVISSGLSLIDIGQFAQSQQLDLKIIGESMFVMQTIGDSTKLYRSNDGSSFTATGSEFSDPKLENLEEVEGQIYLTLGSPNFKLLRLNLEQNSWVKLAENDCEIQGFATLPLPWLNCSDGRLFALTEPGWAELSQDIKVVGTSSQLLLSQSKTDPKELFIWENGLGSWYQVTLSGALQFSVYKNRIFISDGLTGLYEFVREQQTVIVLVSSDSTYSIVEAANGQTLFIQQPNNNFISSSSGTYQQITTVGKFNHAADTLSGYFLWQTDGGSGGLAQYGILDYVKVNAWSSTTSPVQVASLGEQGGLVSVVTQSGTGNLNLYKSSDFLHWSRVTLPSAITYEVPISQARLLAEGTLVESEGVVSVSSGVVSSLLMYVQDASAGIQVYLSSDKGALRFQPNQKVRFDGTISSSQAKRVGLNSLSDVDLIGVGSVLPQKIELKDANQYLGRTVKLDGTLSDLETDSSFVADGLNLLKTHFVGIKEKYLTGDRVELPVVIDFNSASGEIESWFLGQGDLLLQRAAPSPKVVPATKATPKASSSKATLKSSTPSSSSILTVAKASKSVPIVQPQIFSAALTDSKATSPYQQYTMLLTTLLAGIIASTGTRFRRFLP